MGWPLAFKSLRNLILEICNTFYSVNRGQDHVGIHMRYCHAHKTCGKREDTRFYLLWFHIATARTGDASPNPPLNLRKYRVERTSKEK